MLYSGFYFKLQLLCTLHNVYMLFSVVGLLIIVFSKKICIFRRCVFVILYQIYASIVNVYIKYTLFINVSVSHVSHNSPVYYVFFFLWICMHHINQSTLLVCVNLLCNKTHSDSGSTEPLKRLEKNMSAGAADARHHVTLLLG